MRKFGRKTVAILAVAVGSLRAAPARADAPAPPAADRGAAAIYFHAGERAYRDGDYTRAAEAFDAANAAAAHPATLWNAARAWDHAGNAARAANAYDLYLKTAPANDQDRANAVAHLARLSERLGRLEVHVAEDGTRVTIDHLPLATPTLFVPPGAHLVESQSGDVHTSELVHVEAGHTESIAFAKRAPEDGPRASALRAGGEPADATEAQHRTRSAVPTYVAGAATIVLFGAASLSGLDTLRAKRDYDANPTAAALESGKSAQLRTNILFAVAGGGALLTFVSAVWVAPLGGREVALAVGPGNVSVAGAF